MADENYHIFKLSIHYVYDECQCWSRTSAQNEEEKRELLLLPASTVTLVDLGRKVNGIHLCFLSWGWSFRSSFDVNL